MPHRNKALWTVVAVTAGLTLAGCALIWSEQQRLVSELRDAAVMIQQLQSEAFKMSQTWEHAQSDGTRVTVGITTPRADPAETYAVWLRRHQVDVALHMAAYPPIKIGEEGR